MAYAAKTEHNSIKIVNTSTGSTLRTIYGDFTSAIVQGEEVHCTQRDGRVRIVNIHTGSTIRTI